MRVIDFIDVDEEDEMLEKLRFLQKKLLQIWGVRTNSVCLFSCIDQRQGIIETRTNLKASLKLEQSLSIIKTM